jgi:hypothetical protein
MGFRQVGQTGSLILHLLFFSRAGGSESFRRYHRIPQPIWGLACLSSLRLEAQGEPASVDVSRRVVVHKQVLHAVDPISGGFHRPFEGRA